MTPITDARFGSHEKDSTYTAVRTMILEGSLAPGAPIVEAELAEHLGVSRTPVRSALHRLQQDGYVLATRRGRKNRLLVAPLTKEDGREVYHIVGALDGLVAWRAAQLPAEAREELATRMARINEDLAAAGGESPVKFPLLLELHSAFHAAFFEAIHAPRLKTLHSNSRPLADRYRRVYSRMDYGQQQKSVREHQQIIEAIRKGDAVKAQCLTLEHWMSSAERLCQIIDVLGEHGNW
jgi:DNA-binding GntR family transcriptional regulator